MRISRFLLAGSIVAATLSGCSEADIESPVISDLVITPQPAFGIICGQEENNVVHVFTGESITISFTATDNEELSQYKLDVHQNFDCHGHAKLEQTVVWEVIDIGNISGKEAQVTKVLNVPDSATAGKYHFSIMVADFFGNAAKTEIFHVIVKNLDDTIPPALTVTEPSVSSITINRSDSIPNDSIRFAGTVTDNRDLELGGNGKLELRYWRVGSANTFDLFNILFVLGTGPSIDFDFTVTVPPTLVAADYIFELRAFDGVNNMSNTVQFSVTITDTQEEDEEG
jgi:hypothetical protein